MIARKCTDMLNVVQERLHDLGIPCVWALEIRNLEMLRGAIDEVKYVVLIKVHGIYSSLVSIRTSSMLGNYIVSMPSLLRKNVIDDARRGSAFRL